MALQDQKKESSKLKRRSLDLQDVRNSPPWTNGGNHAGENNGKEDDKDSSVSSMSRNESFTIDYPLVGQWGAEVKQISSPMMLSPRYLVETATTNDSDELELATSECSYQLDMNWQLHVPKLTTTTGISNGLVSNKAKKSACPRQARNQETRYS